jgi:benzoylformate decarboxylase
MVARVDTAPRVSAAASGNGAPPAGDTVRDATFAVLRRLGLTTMFANPGSTEVPFLAGLPGDLRFVLGLHEGAVIGMAAGYALGSGAPALALLHSTPGLGNAVAALATARQNRAPLVVLVGQQDRRHLAQDPFLAGRLEGLAGDYPVWVDQPARAQDVPGAIVRAHHEAATARGPALVIVPMDDWAAPAPAAHEVLGPRRLLRCAAPSAAVVDELAAVLDAARAPAIVAGAGADGAAGWAALEALAERLDCAVWQEPFGGAAGFPQHHPRFAGHLPARRARLRDALARYDTVLVVGTGALRQYPYDEGPLVTAGTTLAVVTQDPEEAHRSPADLAVLGSPAEICAALALAVEPRASAGPLVRHRPPAAPPAPADGEPLRAGHVLAALGARLPDDAVLVEETPSSRPELHARVAIRRPHGFVSAMGLLGFALPAAVGVRMARPDRPVVAVVGDGAALYQILALWSAARYEAGVLFVVLSNGGYAIMDRLAERSGQSGPWPALEGIDVSALARAQGVEAVRVERHDDLLERLGGALAGLARRTAPLVLEVAVAQDPTFDP